ncbi:uncharacterized protein SS50377_28822 [Spironucleus salmonicida]|uniref:Uncharacterized protein n=1 Tax=Spironucleus salmonicida TaxID=348837 RepID=A0A9P8LJT6_9EUKA|nr:hypothetical protein SS50377_28822 [Spironucleus salmonicida]
MQEQALHKRGDPEAVHSDMTWNSVQQALTLFYLFIPTLYQRLQWISWLRWMPKQSAADDSRTGTERTPSRKSPTTTQRSPRRSRCSRSVRSDQITYQVSFSGFQAAAPSRVRPPCRQQKSSCSPAVAGCRGAPPAAVWPALGPWGSPRQPSPSRIGFPAAAARATRCRRQTLGIALPGHGASGILCHGPPAHSARQASLLHSRSGCLSQKFSLRVVGCS